MTTKRKFIQPPGGLRRAWGALAALLSAASTSSLASSSAACRPAGLFSSASFASAALSAALFSASAFSAAAVTAGTVAADGSLSRRRATTAGAPPALRPMRPSLIRPS